MVYSNVAGSPLAQKYSQKFISSPQETARSPLASQLLWLPVLADCFFCVLCMCVLDLAKRCFLPTSYTSIPLLFPPFISHSTPSFRPELTSMLLLSQRFLPQRQTNVVLLESINQKANSNCVDSLCPPRRSLTPSSQRFVFWLTVDREPIRPYAAASEAILDIMVKETAPFTLQMSTPHPSAPLSAGHIPVFPFSVSSISLPC